MKNREWWAKLLDRLLTKTDKWEWQLNQYKSMCCFLDRKAVYNLDYLHLETPSMTPTLTLISSDSLTMIQMRSSRSSSSHSCFWLRNTTKQIKNRTRIINNHNCYYSKINKLTWDNKLVSSSTSSSRLPQWNNHDINKDSSMQRYLEMNHIHNHLIDSHNNHGISMMIKKALSNIHRINYYVD